MTLPDWMRSTGIAGVAVACVGTASLIGTFACLPNLYCAADSVMFSRSG